ncbi:hypothetical protein [Kocuria marina]|uniref:hypothetical protein n=1 Tax=Kocuria marina TaxID=223184 RepID=UPI0016426929|nr:hypothetical protein [Kocuria indica]
MAKTTSPRTWLTTLALIGAFAVTGCGSGNDSGASNDAAGATQGSTPQGGEQTSTDSSGTQPQSGDSPSGEAQSGTPQAGASATPDADHSADVYELTETYTDPAKLFTVKYPKSWKVQKDNGYLELTSPDGKVQGKVASTKVRPPKGDWFTRPTHPLIGEETGLSKQVGTQVFTYSTYVPAPPRSERSDSILWGLTESGGQGIVSLPGGDKRDELWAEFYYAPVNEGNRPLSQSQGVKLVNQINETDEAGTVDAILKSIRAVH